MFKRVEAFPRHAMGLNGAKKVRDIGGKEKRKHDFENPPSKRSEKAGSTDMDQMLLDRLNAPRKTVKEVSVDDLKKVENAVDMLGQSLRTIMDLTPDVYSHSNLEIDSRLKSPKIMLAQYLTSMSNLGILGKVETLVNNSQGTLEYVHPSAILPLKAVKDTLATQFHNSSELSKHAAQTSKRETIFMSKREVNNKSKKVASWPPPLPEITDLNLRTQVFTHKSVAGMHHYLTEVEQLDKHNERLEFLGDSIVNSLIAVIAYDRFPYMHEGDLSNIRTALITNNTMSEWAKMYGMDKELKFYEPDLSKRAGVVGGRGAAASTPKYIADAFEAYVGGLWVNYGAGSQSVAVIRPWLEELASPMLMSIEQAQEGSVPLDYEAKKSLYTKIGSSALSPSYVTTKTMSNGFVVVECRMGEELLASGTARTAREAGLRAAMKVLQKPDVLDKYAQLRRDTPRIIPENAVVSPEQFQSESAPELESSKQPKSTALTTYSEDPTLLQLNFIKDNEAEFAKHPKKYFASLLGDRKDLIRYETKEKDQENGKDVFESTLYLEDMKLGVATGSSTKSAEKRAAYFSLSQNYIKVHEWLNKQENKAQ